MKVALFLNHASPVKVEEILMEDVSEFNINDSGMSINFNNTPPTFIPFRANDGEGELDWTNITLVATRVGLRIDMNH
jgi:hypothetical protein